MPPSPSGGRSTAKVPVAASVLAAVALLTAALLTMSGGAPADRPSRPRRLLDGAFVGTGDGAHVDTAATFSQPVIVTDVAPEPLPVATSLRGALQGELATGGGFSTGGGAHPPEIAIPADAGSQTGDPAEPSVLPPAVATAAPFPTAATATLDVPFSPPTLVPRGVPPQHEVCPGFDVGTNYANSGADGELEISGVATAVACAMKCKVHGRPRFVFANGGLHIGKCWCKVDFASPFSDPDATSGNACLPGVEQEAVQPAVQPTAVPTASPTAQPTVAPTASPTSAPTEVSTVSTQRVVPGDNVLHVASESDFAEGDEIVISGGGNVESAIVAGLGTLVLAGPVQHSYPPGSSVTRNSQRVGGESDVAAAFLDPHAMSAAAENVASEDQESLASAAASGAPPSMASSARVDGSTPGIASKLTSREGWVTELIVLLVAFNVTYFCCFIKRPEHVDAIKLPQEDVIEPEASPKCSVADASVAGEVSLVWSAAADHRDSDLEGAHLPTIEVVGRSAPELRGGRWESEGSQPNFVPEAPEVDPPSRRRKQAVDSSADSRQKRSSAIRLPSKTSSSHSARPSKTSREDERPERAIRASEQVSKFTVVLDRANGGKLGIDFRQVDRTLMLITAISDEGLFQKWNAENPEFVVIPGDIIMRVNDVTGNAPSLVEECKKRQMLEITMCRKVEFLDEADHDEPATLLTARGRGGAAATPAERQHQHPQRERS